MLSDGARARLFPILGTPVLPQLLEIEFRWSRAHFLKRERCIYCDVLQQEMREENEWSIRTRISWHFVPLPRSGPTSFGWFPSGTRPRSRTIWRNRGGCRLWHRSSSRASSASKSSRSRLHLVVHTEPNLQAWKPTKEWWQTLRDDYHWHIKIQPDVEGRRRILGTEGFHFNPIPAEQAALVLRALTPGFEPPPTT